MFQGYLITCKKSSRIDHYNDLPENIKIIHAVDTRENHYKLCYENNFNIKIINWYEHFLVKPGAFGNFITHYKLWYSISKLNTEQYTYIFEDDVSPGDLKTQMSKSVQFKTPIVNLNYRGDDGTEAYALNSVGAKLLVDECNMTISQPTDKFMFCHSKSKNKDYFSHIPCVSLAEWGKPWLSEL